MADAFFRGSVLGRHTFRKRKRDPRYIQAAGQARHDFIRGREPVHAGAGAGCGAGIILSGDRPLRRFDSAIRRHGRFARAARANREIPVRNGAGALRCGKYFAGAGFIAGVRSASEGADQPRRRGSDRKPHLSGRDSGAAHLRREAHRYADG